MIVAFSNLPSCLPCGSLFSNLIDVLLSVVEIVSFLYAILMNAGNTQSSSSSTLPEATINLVTEALCMLNFMGTVDLKVLQVSDADGNFRKVSFHENDF